ncbi:CBS domain-containing protein [Oscillatoria laete-virens NRMC-F 0139]|nr:CBS domain-containing protein [Oscillatoria laete-virens]MDL5055272.1 CBS domain-containing protein [Oscillatoria laete-virens NRMC-F 0139]
MTLMTEPIVTSIPETAVANLMSYGLQTVEAGARLRDIAGWMRRVGHEGFPVMEGGRIVGLLTRRDADRAAEHGLLDLRARDIMIPGGVTVTSSDTISTLIQRMVETGWWQIPVVEGTEERPIGIVTRTDVLKFWASRGSPPAQDRFPDAQITQILGTSAGRMIGLIADLAAEMNLRVYMVGGVVRDLLLHRPNDDIDFVMEGPELGIAARRLASALAGRYGGTAHHHAPFGTSKWLIDSSSPQMQSAGLDPSALPDHIDLVSARHEYYEQPTALPSVYSSSIKLDLQRRDFTINTLAIQISPPAERGRLLDEFGGRADLDRKLIRVLHSMSFVDDPTRILRAVRYAVRLGFTIEPRTSELIDVAVQEKMLAQITGERLRNELTLMLEEENPAEGLLELQRRGALKGIHPAFVIRGDITALVTIARQADFSAVTGSAAPPTTDILWHIIGGIIDHVQVDHWAERLMFGKTRTASIVRTSKIIQQDPVTAFQQPPSRIDRLLANMSDEGLCAIWVLLPEAREKIELFARRWRHVRPQVTGETLQASGLKPGKCFGILLSRLREARLDGLVSSVDEEMALVHRMIEEGACL